MSNDGPAPHPPLGASTSSTTGVKTEGGGGGGGVRRGSTQLSRSRSQSDARMAKFIPPDMDGSRSVTDWRFIHLFSESDLLSKNGTHKNGQKYCVSLHHTAYHKPGG